MKILLLLRKLDCNDGISAYSETLIKGLIDIGHEVYTLTGPVNKNEDTAIRYHNISANSKIFVEGQNVHPFPSIRDLWFFIRFIRDNEIDLVHSNGLSTCFLGFILRCLSRRPIVITYHPSAHGNLEDVINKEKQIGGFFRTFYLRIFFPDALLVMSEENKRLFDEKVPRFAQRVMKILGGIDTKYYRPPSEEERRQSRQLLCYANDDFVVTLLGRLSFNKGHDVVVRAIDQLKRKNLAENIKCLIVGDGGDANAIKSHAYEIDQSRTIFQFIGFIKDVRIALWASDVLVLPSRVEGFALVVAEAMAVGLVPIRTPSGGAIDQIINNHTGLIIPFEDSAALAAAILNLKDQDRRSQIGRNAIKHAHSYFSKDLMVTKTLELYKQLLLVRKIRPIKVKSSPSTESAD